MAEKLGKWASNRGLISKIRPSDAAKGIRFPRRWYGGMISANLEVIWAMSAKLTTSLISLGANVAPAGRSLVEMLEIALESVAGAEGITLRSRSRWFRTPAYPKGSGPDFVNAAAVLDTSLEPERVLTALHGAEEELGRVRPARWAPRVCDLDLIAVEDMVLPDRETLERWMALDLGQAQTVAPPRLILPHPRMHERGFVLAPLADIAPQWRHPATGAHGGGDAGRPARGRAGGNPATRLIQAAVVFARDEIRLRGFPAPPPRPPPMLPGPDRWWAGRRGRGVTRAQKTQRGFWNRRNKPSASLIPDQKRL